MSQKYAFWSKEKTPDLHWFYKSIRRYVIYHFEASYQRAVKKLERAPCFSANSFNKLPASFVVDPVWNFWNEPQNFYETIF